MLAVLLHLFEALEARQAKPSTLVQPVTWGVFHHGPLSALQSQSGTTVSGISFFPFLPASLPTSAQGPTTSHLNSAVTFQLVTSHECILCCAPSLESPHNTKASSGRLAEAIGGPLVPPPILIHDTPVVSKLRLLLKA